VSVIYHEFRKKCALDRKMTSSYFNGLDALYHHAKFVSLYSQAKNQNFRPAGANRCTDSREIWHDKARGGSAWLHEISRQEWERGTQNIKKSHFLVKSPRRGEPLDRFLKFSWDFIRPTILHI